MGAQTLSLAAVTRGCLLAYLVLAAADAQATPQLALTSADKQLHEHLEELDRELRGRLECLVLNRAEGRAPRPEASTEAQNLQAHLRALTTVSRTSISEADSGLKDTLEALDDQAANFRAMTEWEVDPQALRAEAGNLYSAEWLDAEWIGAESLDGDGPPANDECRNALPITFGTHVGSTTLATNDGSASCGLSESGPDVWFRIVPTPDGLITADTFGSDFDTVLSLHRGCPGTARNTATCNDNSSSLQSELVLYNFPHNSFFLRLSGFADSAGRYTLNLRPRRPAISGTVTDASTGDPIYNAIVATTNADTGYTRQTWTNNLGNYTINSLEPNRHYIRVLNGRSHQASLYRDLPCPSGSCDPTAGEPIEVSLDVSGIDFALEVGARVTGVITNSETGEPVSGAQVRVLGPEGTITAFAETNRDGEYAVQGLSAGSYVVTTENSRYRDEIYPGLPCNGGVGVGCEISAGTPIDAAPPATVANIDFALESLGQISGTVTDRATGQLLPYAVIRIYDVAGAWIAQITANSDGQYLIGGLAAGDYFLKAKDYQYEDQLYEDRPCPSVSGSECDVTSGTAVTLTQDANQTAIDFTLDQMGGLTGQLTSEADNQPIPSARVYLRDVDADILAIADTNLLGEYEVTALTAGSYFVTTETSDFRNQLYDGLPWDRRTTDISLGTSITVEPTVTTLGIDFALRRGGVLAGTVTTDGVPIEGLELHVYDTDGARVRGAITDSSGHFEATRLPTGNLYVVARGYRYLDELYPNIPCEDLRCDFTHGTAIAVGPDATVTGIDFGLISSARVTGTVTDEDTGELVPTDVQLFSADGRLVGSDRTLGTFWIDDLPAGTYFARTKVLSDHQNEHYGGLPCLDPECDPTSGTPIEVGASAVVRDIDFALSRNIGGPLVGDVTHATTGEPVSAYLDIWNASGVKLTTRTADSAGRYFSRRLAPGTYFVSARAPGFYTQLYGGRLCPPGPLTGCDPTSGQPVSVTGEAGLVTGINFALVPVGEACTASDTALCLAGGRFRVAAAWKDHDGVHGSGHGQALTGNTGTFWFFDPTNVEVVVKVLDACSLAPFHSYWVYAAGLTDVEVTLVVTDTWTDEQQTYVNALGAAFQPVRDTGAFATCP